MSPVKNALSLIALFLQVDYLQNSKSVWDAWTSFWCKMVKVLIRQIYTADPSENNQWLRLCLSQTFFCSVDMVLWIEIFQTNKSKLWITYMDIFDQCETWEYKKYKAWKLIHFQKPKTLGAWHKKKTNMKLGKRNTLAERNEGVLNLRHTTWCTKYKRCVIWT